MAHLIEKNNMMYVGEKPWHNLGVQVQENISTEDAIKAAGLDWTVKAVPLYTGSEYGSQQVANRAIMRETDNRILGVVGSEYVPLQNKEAFKFFDPFLKDHQANLETAGSLKKGENIWVLAKLNRDPIEVTKDDIVDKYLLLSNSHKGGIAVRVGFTPVRVVCNNTLAMATSDSRSQLMRIGHSSKVVQDLESVREIMNLANQQFEATADQYKYLATRRISRADLAAYVKVIFKTKEDTERSKTRADKMNETITRLFETGMGNDNKYTRGTYWALYNATTQYLTHDAHKDDDRRLYNLWFGSAFQTNKEALELAVKMAGA